MAAHHLLQHVLRVPVRDLARLPDERGVDHVAPRHLLVEVLQTQQEGAVPEPRHDGLRHPLQVHVAGEDGEVRGRDRGGGARGVTVRHQHVYQQL